MSFDLSTAFLLVEKNSVKESEIISVIPLDAQEVQALVPVGTVFGTYKILYSDGSLLIVDSVNQFTSFYLAETKKIYLLTQVNGYGPGSPFVMSAPEFSQNLVIKRDIVHARGYMIHPINSSEMKVKMVF